jgi:tellurite resistance protein TehA-like permease
MSDPSSLMMEAARTSEMSVDNYFTRQYIPEDSSELENFSFALYLPPVVISSAAAASAEAWCTI